VPPCVCMGPSSSRQVVLLQHLLNWSQSVELRGCSQYAPAFEPVQPRFEERACGRHPGQVHRDRVQRWVPPAITAAAAASRATSSRKRGTLH
jgi:hypothetical protein